MPFSDLNFPKQKLCHRLQYDHQVDAYLDNPESQSHCQKFKHSLFRIRQLRSKSLSRTQTKNQDYNKYYIKPDMRYKKKSEDPKKKVLVNAKETYFYDNLHNKEFWEWKHPFDKDFIYPDRKSIQDKVNPKILEKFKEHLEQNSHSRLPLVVRSVLEQKL